MKHLGGAGGGGRYVVRYLRTIENLPNLIKRVLNQHFEKNLAMPIEFNNLSLETA